MGATNGKSKELSTELEAMHIITGTLQPLPRPSRRRVLQWVNEAFGEEGSQEDSPAPKVEGRALEVVKQAQPLVQRTSKALSETLELAKKKVVIRARDVESGCHVSPSGAEQRLAVALKRGIIRRVAHGLYAPSDDDRYSLLQAELKKRGYADTEAKKYAEEVLRKHGAKVPFDELLLKVPKRAVQ